MRRVSRLHAIDVGHLMDEMALEHSRTDSRARDHDLESVALRPRVPHERELGIDRDPHRTANVEARIPHRAESILTGLANALAPGRSTPLHGNRISLRVPSL